MTDFGVHDEPIEAFTMTEIRILNKGRHTGFDLFRGHDLTSPRDRRSASAMVRCVYRNP